MTPIDQYADENDKLRLLLQGAPGSGKTTVACQFPNSYVIDVDVNLGGTLRFLKEHKLKLPIGFDVLDKDEDKLIELPNRYARLEKLLLAAQQDKSIETIIFDSGTTLADVLIAEVNRQQGKKDIGSWKDGRQFWGFFAPFCRNFFGILSQIRKHVVLIVHEKLNTLESGAVVYPIAIAWPGQVGKNIGAFFTNNWRCEVDKQAKGLQTEYKWNIRTMPDSKYELKNTLGLPPVFEFKWELIQAALDKGKEMK